MLALLIGVTILSAAAIWVITAVTMRTMKRLGLDLMPTLVWLGLAEVVDPPPHPATRVFR
jgi:hypothetical protein